VSIAPLFLHNLFTLLAKCLDRHNITQVRRFCNSPKTDTSVLDSGPLINTLDIEPA